MLCNGSDISASQYPELYNILKKPTAFPSSKSSMNKITFDNNKRNKGRIYKQGGVYYYLVTNGASNAILYKSNDAYLSNLTLINTFSTTSSTPYYSSAHADGSFFLLGTNEEERDYEYPYVTRVGINGSISYKFYLGRSQSGYLRNYIAQDMAEYHGSCYFIATHTSKTYVIKNTDATSSSGEQIVYNFDQQSSKIDVFDELDMLFISIDGGYVYSEDGTSFTQVIFSNPIDLISACYNSNENKIYATTDNNKLVKFTPKSSTYDVVSEGNIGYDSNIIYNDLGKYVTVFSISNSTNTAITGYYGSSKYADVKLVNNSVYISTNSYISYIDGVTYISLWYDDSSYTSDYGIYIYNNNTSLPIISSSSNNSQPTYVFIKAK